MNLKIQQKLPTKCQKFRLNFKMVDKETLNRYLTKRNIILGLAIICGVIIALGLAIGIPLSSNLKKANKILDKYILIDG